MLIGGVGYRWLRDMSFGVVASDELARQEWPAGVEVSDLGYGAHFVTQDLLDAQPPYDRLVLLAGVERGGPPGELRRYNWKASNTDPEEVQARMREAGAGVVDVDHLLVIAEHFKGLPKEVVVVEVEPVEITAGEALSPKVAALLPEVFDLVRREALARPVAKRRAP